MPTTINHERDLDAEVRANAARVDAEYAADDQTRAQIARALARPTVADVLTGAAERLQETYTAERITTPFLSAALKQTARKLADTYAEEDALLKEAADALYARLPVAFMTSWIKPIATAEVLDALRDAARSAQSVAAKQAVLAARRQTPPAAPADPVHPSVVYADAEYDRERADYWPDPDRAYKADLEDASEEL